MKILALGDPHGELPKNLDLIIRKNKIDVIVCIGEVFPIKRDKDNTGNADLKAGDRILDKICSYKIPTIIFKGNMFLSGKGARYFRDLVKKYKKKYKNLQYRRIGKLKIDRMNFILFDMIYEEHSHGFLSKYFTNSIKNNEREKRLNKLLNESENPIVLSHAPPYGILDKTKSGKHVGSKILLKAIKKHQPKLVLCGHIHEAKGKAKIGKTQVINLGCCGDYEIIEV